jgi:hypothetical protein
MRGATSGERCWLLSVVRLGDGDSTGLSTADRTSLDCLRHTLRNLQSRVLVGCRSEDWYKIYQMKCGGVLKGGWRRSQRRVRGDDAFEPSFLPQREQRKSERGFRGHPCDPKAPFG